MNAPPPLVAAIRRVPRRLRAAWAQLRAWRRIKFTRAGAVFTLGAFAVGFAAINTGNNLLYLLLGAMLGLVAVSSWLSEQVIRDLRIERWVPRGVPVGHEVRIVYRVRNEKRWLPTMAVEIMEAGLSEPAFLAKVAPAGEAQARSVNRFIRRGIYPLGTVTLSTTFPFGLFLKERDIRQPGELVIWPRADLPVRAPMPGAGHTALRGTALYGAAGIRGEYRGLREFRPGDDPRDIHWRRSARLDTPVVREYERDASETLWICLDLGGEPDDVGEHLVEVAASLAARALMEGKRFGLVAGEHLVRPGTGAGQFENVLDALARVDFRPLAPVPAPPVDPAACVLVSRTGRQQSLYSDAFVGGGGPGRGPDRGPGRGPDFNEDRDPPARRAS
ncbi:MAG TPA: DUF58 domain-containing protein [Longimicrobiales bacterium]